MGKSSGVSKVLAQQLQQVSAQAQGGGAKRSAKKRKARAASRPRAAAHTLAILQELQEAEARAASGAAYAASLRSLAIVNTCASAKSVLQRLQTRRR